MKTIVRLNGSGKGIKRKLKKPKHLSKMKMKNRFFLTSPRQKKLSPWP